MPKNVVIAYGLTAVAGFAAAAVAIWLLWPDILEQIEVRPWPPTLSELADTIEAGDSYSLTWQPSTGGPTPEFYYLERSTAKNFLTSTRQHVPHKAGQTPSHMRIASAVSSSTTYYYRVLTGYKSKHLAGAEVLSDASNVESITVKPLAAPSVFPIKGPLFSAQTYSVSWTSVSKANAYTVEVQAPTGTTQSTQSATALSVTAPVLTSASAQYCYRVRAAKAAGSSWTTITGWSNKECVQIQRVAAPGSLSVTPSTLESEKPYTLTWAVPAPGPTPVSDYEYQIRRKQGTKIDELAWQKSTTLAGKGPKVSSTQTLQFSVRARFKGNPMTVYSTPVTVTVKPPPPPPPPSITKVSPTIAAHGDTVTVTGKHLSKTTLSLHTTAGKSLAVTPKSQTASSVSFVVPKTASWKTSELRLTAKTVAAKASFTVARKPGKFVERQDQVHIVPLTRTCSTFSSELTVLNSVKHEYAGRFKQGSKVLVNIPSPGFKAYSYQGDIVGGLGFSKACKVGVQIGQASASSALMFVNFYALDLGADGAFSGGSKIKGPHSIRPSGYYKKGFKLLFSPDETIVAVINRRKPFGTEFGISIWVLDLLTGIKLPKSPFLYDGTAGHTFGLSVSKSNQLVIERGGVSAPPVSIPTP